MLIFHSIDLFYPPIPLISAISILFLKFIQTLLMEKSNRDAAIFISPIGIRAGDVGSVFVVGSMEREKVHVDQDNQVDSENEEESSDEGFFYDL